MHCIVDGYLLMIEPSDGSFTTEPCEDEISRMLDAILARSTAGNSYRGVHTCSCGTHSDNRDHILPDGTITNSLARHYIRHHRSDVPGIEIQKIYKCMASSGHSMGNLYDAGAIRV